MYNTPAVTTPAPRGAGLDNNPDISMPQPLVVVINDVAHLEYDRSKALPDAQRRYLDRMDRDMDRGIDVGSERIAAPDRMQRAQFVALSLIGAVQNGNDALAAAACAWLADRLPELQQVRALVQDQGTAVDLVFDKPYVKEQKISFVRPENLKKRQ